MAGAAAAAAPYRKRSMFDDSDDSDGDCSPPDGGGNSRGGDGASMTGRDARQFNELTAHNRGFEAGGVSPEKKQKTNCKEDGTAKVSCDHSKNLRSESNVKLQSTNEVPQKSTSRIASSSTVKSKSSRLKLKEKTNKSSKSKEWESYLTAEDSTILSSDARNIPSLQYYKSQKTKSNASNRKPSNTPSINVSNAEDSGLQATKNPESVIIESSSVCIEATASTSSHGSGDCPDDAAGGFVPEEPAGGFVPEEPVIVLTPAQRARIETNRQRALLIRREKMNKVLPPIKKSERLEKEGKKIVRINDTNLVDTGGGFFVEEADDDDAAAQFSLQEIKALLKKNKEPAPLIEEDRPDCLDCGKRFDTSYLKKNFDHPACDDCRDNDRKHALVTKTDARSEYLLQDVDLDQRPPPLRYIVRKNPHNDRWGDMKLYLKLQVEKRCLEVWGSEEALEEAIEKKNAQREISKGNKFKKKMQELRMNVRSSLYTRATKSHEHEYGEEEYIAADDEYSKTCSTCGHCYKYDKM